MRRRRFLETIGAAAGAAITGACSQPAPEQAAAKQPNIVLIMADDLGWKELGCFGQEKIETPNIDRLASQGIRFTDFHAGSAVCAPDRCTLMTGMDGGHAVVRNNYEAKPSIFGDSFGGQYPLPGGTVTMASMLKQKGYATGAFGKWGLGGVGTTGDPLRQGFDRFFGFNCQRHAHNLYPRYLVDDEGQRFLKGNTRGLTGEQYGPQVVADEMLKWVRQNQDGPFLCYYPTVLPHLALQAPEEEVAHYRGRWPETPYNGKSYLPNPTPRATYAAMITFMDKQVGRLMSLLDELNLADNTIVMFTSDNGTTMLKQQVDYEFFDSVGPLRGLKGSLYEGGIRVPLVARWPGNVKPGTVSNLPSVQYDLMATAAGVANVESLPNTDGVSILPSLLGEPDKQEKHDYMFWDFAGYGGQLAVRMGPWKGIKQNVKKDPDAPLELYNLDEDIGEQKDFSADQPELTAKMEKIMVEARTVPAEERFRFGKYPT